MEPLFVTFEHVLRAHDESLRRYGGSSGVRDHRLLRSAVDQPLNDLRYGGADLFAIAAAYAYHIGQAQAFFDGNKRTGISIALIFLEQNGMATIGNVPRLYDAMIAIAERRMDKAGLAALFRELFTQDG